MREQNEPHIGRFERFKGIVWSKIARRLGTSALILATGLQGASCAGGEPIPDKTRDLRNIPTETSFCNGKYQRTGVHSAPEGMVLVDPRCTSDPDGPLVIRGDSEVTGEKLGTAKAGAVLEPLCYENGQTIYDKNGVGNSRWIRVVLEKTYEGSSPVQRTRPYKSDEMAFLPAAGLNGTNGPVDVWKTCNTVPPGLPNE